MYRLNSPAYLSVIVIRAAISKRIKQVMINGTKEGEYIITASDGVYKTTDGGENWSHYNTGIEGLYVTDIIKLSGDEILIGTVGHGVYHSTDGGKTWEPYGIGLEYKNISCIEIVYVTDEDDGLYVTTEMNGAWSYDFTLHKWYPINDGNDNLVGNRAIAGDSHGNLFLASSPYIYSSSRFPQIGWSIDTQFELANDFIITSNDEVFASSLGDGVKRRESPGIWIDFSDGLVSDNGYVDVVNLDLDQNGYFWAAVAPLNPSVIGGVFKTVNPITSIDDKVLNPPEGLKLIQNYPNPFNPITKIKYSIPYAQMHGDAPVRLEVYDILGEKIALLVNEKQQPGYYEVAFDGSRLAGGVYFYSLSSGNFHQTKKMILLK